MRHEAPASFPRGGDLGLATVLLVGVSLTWVLLFAAPAVSQTQATDPLANEPALIAESTEDSDVIVDRIVIEVQGCRVAPNATVTVEDDDGTRAELTNGQNVTITGDADQVTIVGTGQGGNIEGINTSGGQFGTVGQTVTGTVITSTGITCGDGGSGGGGTGGGSGGGGSGPDGDQYGDDRELTVIVKTIPDKPLPKTGGIPPLLGAGVLLAFAALVSVGILRR